MMLTRELVVLARLLEATCGQYTADGVFSDLLSAPTNAVRTLEKHGILKVESGVGRALHAKWLDTSFRQADGAHLEVLDRDVIDAIYLMFHQYVNHPDAQIIGLPVGPAWTYAFKFLCSVGVVELIETSADRRSTPKIHGRFRDLLDFWRRRHPDVDWSPTSHI